MNDLEKEEINSVENYPTEEGEGKTSKILHRMAEAIRDFIQALLNRESPMENIRKLQKRDSKSISSLLAQLGGENEDRITSLYDFIRSHPLNEVYVYEENGSIIGLLGFRLRQNLEDGSQYGEISIIVVDENHRRKGIGQKLFAFAENLARQHKCKGTWLVSGFHRSSEAHKFYGELGYEATGYRFVKKF